jgi:hypothetical protein
VFDYRRKRVDSTEIIAPGGTALERAALWNAAEKSEKRVDAQVAREIEVALPGELSPADMRGLVRSFVQEQFVSRGMIADIAFHNLTGTGSSNPHAHILLTLRAWDGNGFGLKRRDWNERTLCAEWRERWADHANAALRAAGQTARIDSRSLADQAADAAEQGKIAEAVALAREPTIHERGNPAARAHNVAVAARNAHRQPSGAEGLQTLANAPALPSHADDDAGFIAAMLAKPGTHAASWRMLHREATAETAWLTAHADDEKQREEQFRLSLLALHNARHDRDEWLRENRWPFWPWRWRGWQHERTKFQEVVNRAKQTARAARAATGPESVIALVAERKAHEKRLAQALTARRQLAELPSEREARRLVPPLPTPQGDTIGLEPAPDDDAPRSRRSLKPR